jgi:hypothetical protein
MAPRWPCVPAAPGRQKRNHAGSVFSDILRCVRLCVGAGGGSGSSSTQRKNSSSLTHVRSFVCPSRSCWVKLLARSWWGRRVRLPPHPSACLCCHRSPVSRLDAEKLSAALRIVRMETLHRCISVYQAVKVRDVNACGGRAAAVANIGGESNNARGDSVIPLPPTLLTRNFAAHHSLPLLCGADHASPGTIL